MHSSLARQSGLFYNYSFIALDKLMVSYNFWQRLSNNMPVYFPYYASIMLHAFGHLLCFKLCQYNQYGSSLNTAESGVPRS